MRPRPPLSRLPEDQPVWAELDKVMGAPDPEQYAAARRMRQADPEVDEHGAATFAEQTRMQHGPEPGTGRLRAVPPNDPWYVGWKAIQP